MALLCLRLRARPLFLRLGVKDAMANAIATSELNQPLIMSDVRNDPLAPSEWLANGVAASVSVPVTVDKCGVGCLHVIDEEARPFTTEHVDGVLAAAQDIGRRLEHFLGPERDERRESLMRRAVSPVLAELRNALVPLKLGTGDLLIVADELAPLVESVKESTREEDLAAVHSYQDLVDLVGEIGRATMRVREVAAAVEGLWGEGGRNVAANDVLASAAGLAYHSTRLVGGITMPEVSATISVHARRSVAAASLGLVLSRAAEANVSVDVSPLIVRPQITDESFTVRVSGQNLSPDASKRIAEETRALLLGDRNIEVGIDGSEIILDFARSS